MATLFAFCKSTVNGVLQGRKVQCRTRTDWVSSLGDFISIWYTNLVEFQMSHFFWHECINLVFFFCNFTGCCVVKTFPTYKVRILKPESRSSNKPLMVLFCGSGSKGRHSLSVLSETAIAVWYKTDCCGLPKVKWSNKLEWAFVQLGHKMFKTLFLILLRPILNGVTWRWRQRKDNSAFVCLSWQQCLRSLLRHSCWELVTWFAFPLPDQCTESSQWCKSTFKSADRNCSDKQRWQDFNQCAGKAEVEEQTTQQTCRLCVNKTRSTQPGNMRLVLRHSSTRSKAETFQTFIAQSRWRQTSDSGKHTFLTWLLEAGCPINFECKHSFVESESTEASIASTWLEALGGGVIVTTKLKSIALMLGCA